MHIVLYKPDIPQNTAAIIRLGACLNLNIHLIEPCGFNLNDRRFKRVVMDYASLSKIVRHNSFEAFKKKYKKSRIVLMTTKAKKLYHKFKFKKNDMLLFGKESAGVPEEIHKMLKNKIKIPMNKKTRSLNVAISVAIVASEALRQNKLLLNIERVQKKISNNNNINSGLAENPFISKRSVETELINELYKIDSVDLDKTVDIRYGNGKCSDYELFENDSSILKKVEKELIVIMSKAVKSEIFIIESFFNILRSGSGLTSHNHLNDFVRKYFLLEKDF